MGDTMTVFAFLGMFSVACLVVTVVVNILVFVQEIRAIHIKLKAEIKELNFKVAYLQESDGEIRYEVFSKKKRGK